MTGWIGVPVVAVAGVALVLLGRWSDRRTPSGFVSRNVRYQSIAALVAVAAVVTVRWLVPQHGSYLVAGDVTAPAHGLGVLGVGDGESWRSVGTSFALIALTVTGLVVWLQIEATRRPRLRQLPVAVLLALPISLINAAVEEAIFRVALAEALAPVAAPTVIALVSGLLFGPPHWFGSPGRLPGVLMAAFIGWLLCQSVLQTGGVLWAWTLHVGLDVVILTLQVGVGTSPAASPSSGEGFR